MKLSKILHNLYQLPVQMDCDITGLALDSRLVKTGDLFFAYQGTHLDGRQFITDAIAKGARAILAEATNQQTGVTLQDHVPIFSIPHLNQKISLAAANFYAHPAHSLKIIGVTGTNGKTSCSHFVAAALEQLGLSSAVIGTLGSGLYGHVQAGNLTTPDAITLQATFRDFVSQDAKVVAMEVSSHSIDQGRVNDIPFEIGIFTNLTRDHLDYHGDMETYGAVKKQLFDNPLLKHAVINADDVFGQSLIHSLHQKQDIYAYSVNKPIQSPVPVIYADNIHLTTGGLEATVISPWGAGQLQTGLIGQFNLSNILSVLTTLCLLGFTFEEAVQALTQLKPVPGRMQSFSGKDQPLVVVDYSHTPDALEKALMALRQHCTGRLYCLFGAGGDRDRGKRPMMAKIAEQLADVVWVTDDNPRHEAPEQIVADIMAGFSKPASIIVQHDRSKAIKDIIQCAKAGDCILIAGRGGETYQQIGDIKIPFSDAVKVMEIINVSLA